MNVCMDGPQFFAFLLVAVGVIIAVAVTITEDRCRIAELEREVLKLKAEDAE